MKLPWTWIIGVVAGLVLIGALVYWVQGVLDDRQAYGEGLGRAEVEAEWTKDKLARNLLALNAAKTRAAKQEADRKKEQEDRDAEAQRTKDLDAALAAADTARGQLRIALNALRVSADGARVPAPGVPASGPDVGAAATGQLLDRCADQLQDVARDADQLSAQVIGLQNYVRRALAFCGAPQ